MATLVEGAVWHAQSSSRLCRCSRRDTATIQTTLSSLMHCVSKAATQLVLACLMLWPLPR